MGAAGLGCSNALFTMGNSRVPVGDWAFAGGVREGISILVLQQIFPERFREERETDRG